MTKMMVDRLYSAQDNNEYVRFDIYGKGVNIVITIIPEVMQVDEWFDITDKKNGSETMISFSIDSDVEYDECGFYSFKSGELTIEIEE